MCNVKSQEKRDQCKRWCSCLKALKRGIVPEGTLTNEKKRHKSQRSQPSTVYFKRWKWKTQVNCYELWRYWENEAREQGNEIRTLKAKDDDKRYGFPL